MVYQICNSATRSAIVMLASALAWAICAMAAAEKTESSGQLPNIVLILADDLGYGDLGSYNPQSKIPTPHLDQLAREGIRFTDAHAAASVCTPSRYAILTGRYCWRSRLKQSGLSEFGATLIEPGRLTLPAMLKSKGYTTSAVGKWHLGWHWPTSDGAPPDNEANQYRGNVDFSKSLGDGPTTRGFDYYFGTDIPNYPPHSFIENDRTVGIPSAAMPLSLIHDPPPKYYGDLGLREGPMIEGWDIEQILPRITSKAAEYIQSHAKENPSKPFFLYLALSGPHTPEVPTAEFRGKSVAGPYGDFVCQVDASVGQILAALEASGLADDTLVMFSSDNGPERTAYLCAEQFSHFSMGDLRGVKRDLWEGGHRVPFIACWPGRIPPGSISSQPICSVDLMSTLASVVGAALPNDAAEDSVDMLPALAGKTSDRPLRQSMIHHSAGGRFAIRQGDWVFIDAPSGEDSIVETDWMKRERGYAQDDQTGQLFNLRDDLAQRHNRFAEEPKRVAELRALLELQRTAERTR